MRLGKPKPGGGVGGGRHRGKGAGFRHHVLHAPKRRALPTPDGLHVACWINVAARTPPLRKQANRASHVQAVPFVVGSAWWLSVCIGPAWRVQRGGFCPSVSFVWRVQRGGFCPSCVDPFDVFSSSMGQRALILSTCFHRPKEDRELKNQAGVKFKCFAAALER